MRITIKVAAAKAGSIAALARLLCVNESTIHRWDTYLPPKYALLFKALCK